MQGGVIGRRACVVEAAVCGVRRGVSVLALWPSGAISGAVGGPGDGVLVSAVGRDGVAVLLAERRLDRGRTDACRARLASLSAGDAVLDELGHLADLVSAAGSGSDARSVRIVGVVAGLAFSRREGVARARLGSTGDGVTHGRLLVGAVDGAVELCAGSIDATPAAVAEVAVIEGRAIHVLGASAGRARARLTHAI